MRYTKLPIIIQQSLMGSGQEICGIGGYFMPCDPIKNFYPVEYKEMFR